MDSAAGAASGGADGPSLTPFPGFAPFEGTLWPFAANALPNPVSAPPPPHLRGSDHRPAWFVEHKRAGRPPGCGAAKAANPTDKCCRRGPYQSICEGRYWSQLTFLPIIHHASSPPFNVSGAAWRARYSFLEGSSSSSGIFGSLCATPLWQSMQVRPAWNPSAMTFAAASGLFVRIHQLRPSGNCGIRANPLAFIGRPDPLSKFKAMLSRIFPAC